MALSIPIQQSAVTLSQFGTPDVLTYQTDVAMPKLEHNCVLVKVAYAGINPVDYKTRQGLGWGAENIKNNQFAQGEPAVLGFDMAGEVVASRSDDFAVGDKVAALNFAGGCYAQYNCVDATLLTKVPDGMSLKVAGALPCAGITALQLLEFADIKAGEHVVMSAPAGGVGHLAVQLLMQKVVEKNVKLTVICSPEKYTKLDSLIDKDKLAGWIDYTKDEQFPSLRADVLLDLVGGDAGRRALQVVKKGGRVVVLPSIWAEELRKAGEDKSLDVKGFVVKPNADDLGDVLNKIADKQLKLHIEAEYPLQQTADAHRELQQGDSFGKIVLEVEA